jgi:galactose mutarotase-like enzyme
MMQTIENSQFQAAIDEHGSQLTHLINKAGNFDYIWNNDLWPKHAPILFPAIGRSNDDAYLIDGKKYEMPQHGFAADYDFEVTAKQADAVMLSLHSSEATKNNYPFDFELTVTFTLTDKGLNVSFTVKNDSDGDLSYSLGYHPAFNVPIANEGAFDDYRVDLEPAQASLDTYEIVKKPNPYRSGKLEKLPNYSNGIVELDHEMFAKGLLIIKNTGIKTVKLYSRATKHAVTVDVADFDHVTLWTKEGANAPFLCIEPFNGLPDVYGDLVELKSKEDNQHLDAKDSKSYQINIALQ